MEPIRQQKKDIVNCMACRKKQTDQNKGLLCPSGHFLCSSSKNNEVACVVAFATLVLTDDEMKLCEHEGGFKVKCPQCKTHIDLTKFEKFVPQKLMETFLSYIAMDTMMPGDQWLVCPICTKGAVYLEHRDIFLECTSESCLQVTCRMCLKNVLKDRLTHLEGCFPLFEDYRRMSEYIAQSLLARCPHCGLSGMKNNACCEIRCSQCDKWWCYSCGCPPEECSMECPGSFTTHLWGDGWKNNMKRCPHYLDQYASVHADFPNEAKSALSTFHRHLYLARLKKMILREGDELVRKVLSVQPRLLENDTIEIILHSKFPDYLKRGRYANLD